MKNLFYGLMVFLLFGPICGFAQSGVEETVSTEIIDGQTMTVIRTSPQKILKKTNFQQIAQVADRSALGQENQIGPSEKLEPCSAKIQPENIEEHLRQGREFSKFYDAYLKGGNRNLAPVVVPIQLHIVRRSDGTGGAGLPGILSELGIVDMRYSVIDVSFQQCLAVNYIDSDTYYNLSGDAEGDALSAANNVANVLNVYFVGNADGACGWARFTADLPVDYIVIDNSCATNTSTLAHEIGHYFDLYHTHETAFGASLVDGTNCATTGDILCDTPADPRLNRDGGLVNGSCMYTGGAAYTDANGDEYNPDPTNIMSYSLKACRTFFSPDQQARMLFTIANGRNYLDFGCATNCELTVDCSNIFDQNLSCRVDLPPANNNLPIVLSACGNAMVSVLTIIPGNSGCPGDEISITRTYTIEDDQDNMEQCVQTFTIVSNVEPTISCPAGGPISCASDIVVSAADATATAECGTPSVNLSGPVIVGTPNCIGTTYTYTYEATDFCNRMASCEQVFTINSSSIAITDCPTGGDVECAADIMTDPSDITVVTNCNVGFNVVITGPVINGQPDCPGTTYTYTYTATSVCGLVVSCSRVFTIANNGPIISCPADVTVACGQDIVVNESDVMVTTACGSTFDVVISGPNVLGGLPNCPGSRYRYYYTVTDACGRAAVCFREFIIENDPPSIVCSPDETVECASDIIIDDSEVTVTTSCPDVDVDITSSTVIDGEPDCPNTTYTITYIATDPCGRSATCSKIWTIQNDAPAIQVCAPDRIVECSSDIMAEPELIEFTVSCELGYTLTPGPVVALNGLGDCPGAIYSITYTLEDVCGRETECTQTFTVDNRAPRVYPDEDQYVACREDIAPRWENCFVETDCNLGIVRYEIIGPIEDDNLPDCNGKIINYLYSVWDACGRMTCVAQAWIIKNDGPTFERLPVDITVDCASVPDGSEIKASFDGCGNVMVMVTDVIIPLAGLDYIIQRTFTAEDDCGNSISAEQMITVLCNSPSGNKEICTYDEREWTSSDSVDGNDKTPKDWLADFNFEENPLVIGLPGRSLAIGNMYCLFQLLPSAGAPASFSPDFGDQILLNGVCAPEGSLTGEDGRLANTLAGELITLKLNIRMNQTLEDVFLSDICVAFSPAIIGALPFDPIVGDVARLSDATLSGRSEMTPKLVEEALSIINDYFDNCRVPGNCGESIANPTDHTIRSSEISSNLSTLKLLLAPNPATQEVSLQYEIFQDQVIQVQVFNADGKLMHAIQNDTGTGFYQEEIDISNWPKGIYLVTLTNGDERLTEKLIKL